MKQAATSLPNLESLTLSRFVRLLFMGCGSCEPRAHSQYENVMDDDGWLTCEKLT
jgi:hypothetical protein